MTHEECIEAAKLWRQFLVPIQSALKTIVLRYAYEVDLDLPEQQSRQQWYSWCREKKSEVDPVVQEWIQTGIVPITTPEKEFGLWIRCVVVRDLIASFLFADDSGLLSMIPAPPPKDHNSVLEGLMLSWWERRGEIAAYTAIFRHAMTEEPDTGDQTV